MRKLLWLIPIFFMLPGLVSIASWWYWFFFGVMLMDPYTELHAFTALVGTMIAIFASAVISGA